MNFWMLHGVWFLIALMVFPRLTLLFAVVTPFGWLAWIAWAFVPSFLVAFLATSMYWQTNPALCVIAWIVAFGKASATGGKAAR